MMYYISEKADVHTYTIVKRALDYNLVARNPQRAKSTLEILNGNEIIASVQLKERFSIDLLFKKSLRNILLRNVRARVHKANDNTLKLYFKNKTFIVKNKTTE